jgi:hypothetical protein
MPGYTKKARNVATPLNSGDVWSTPKAASIGSRVQDIMVTPSRANTCLKKKQSRMEAVAECNSPPLQERCQNPADFRRSNKPFINV